MHERSPDARPRKRRSHWPVRGLSARALAGGLLAMALLACGPGSSDAAAQVAGGTLDGRPWVARVGVAGASGICLEVHVEGVSEDNRLCGLHEGESGLWRFDVGGGTFVTGTVADARAVKTDLTLADGSVESAEVAGAGTTTSLRFFVLVVPLGAPLDRLDFLNAAGEVIDSQPLD